MKEKKEYLKMLPIFREMKENEIDSIIDTMIIEEVSKGKYVFEEGISCIWLYFVCEGRVKLLTHSASGRDFIIRIVSKNDIITDNNMLFKRNPECVYSAKALENSIVIKITVSDFLSFMDRHAELYKHYIELMDWHIMEAYSSLKNMAFEKVERRIARHLIKFAMNTGEKTDRGLKLGVKLSRQEMANLTGTTIETAIRVMSKFKKTGIITESGGIVTIIDRHRLVNIAEEF